MVGFLMEHIDGASTATIQDVEACNKALAQLHSVGIKHGDLIKHDFLVKQDDKVAIVDFETATKCNEEQLGSELTGLRASLEDQSGLGGQSRRRKGR